MSASEFLVVLLSLAGALLVIGIVFYDVGVAGHSHETVSWWLLQTGKRYPILPIGFAFVLGVINGVLLGHLWFPQR